MPILRRTDSVLISPVSPASSNSPSSCSRFSLRSFLTSSSVSARSSRTITNAVSSSVTSKQSSTINAKLVFGISGRNFKPGLLFTQPNNSSCTTAQLVFLPMARTFKNVYTKPPFAIIEQFISVFKEAREILPKSSKFSAAFSDENLKRLEELLEQATLWEECAQVESKLLIKTEMHVLPLTEKEGEDSVVQRLLRQPNIFEILGEISKILACDDLGIPSPPPETIRQSATSSSSFALRASSPLYEDCRERSQDLTASLRQLSISDPITNLSLETLDQLIDKFTTLHIPIYSWFGPYEDAKELVDEVSSALEACFEDANALKKDLGTTVEKEGISIAGIDVATGWAKDAIEMGRRVAEFNVWCLALQRCRKVRAGFSA